MNEWLIVLSLISLGIVLLGIEILFVPGTTVIGLLGFAIMIVGVVLSFRYFGDTTGWVVGVGSIVTYGAVLYFCFKTNVWSRFASKGTIDSRVNEGELKDLQIGMEGIAVSALRPTGKAELSGKVYEVKTFGSYLETGRRLKVVEILSNQIVVEQIN
jgi:membrane-bound ClpP family serine protease